MIDTLLKKRVNNPIRIGLLGCGFMGRSFIRQVWNTEGVRVVAVCNRSLSRAFDVCRKFHGEAGIGDIDSFSAIEVCVVTDDPMKVIHAKTVDVIVDVTGSLEYSARVIMEAFKVGKPVLTMNAELQATVGCALSRHAEAAGVLFSDSDGDQPGVEMGLLRYVKHLGLEPVVVGNMKGFMNVHAVRADIEKWVGMNEPSKVVAFTDGTKLALEQALVANATGAAIHKRGMIGIQGNGVHINDVYGQFPLDKVGLISDYVINCDKPYGVFCVAKHKEKVHETFIKELEYLHCGKGPYYCFHAPNHLCSFDIIGSIVRMVALGDEVIRPLKTPKAGVLTVAKRDLAVGTVLDGIGGELCYGLCDNFDALKTENLIPIGLTEGCVLKRAVKRDRELTFDDVELPEGRVIDKLWKEQ